MVIFFFYLYDEDAGTTVPVPVDDIDIENDEELEFFFDDKVRKVWHRQEEEWYFSIVDVCQVLTDSADGRKYWNKLKQRLKEEGNELVTNCHQLKMKSHKDGKSIKPMLPVPNSFSVSSSPYRPKRRNLSKYGWPRSVKNGWMRSRIPSLRSSV